MKYLKLAFISPIILFFLPVIAGAQPSEPPPPADTSISTPQNFREFVNIVLGIIDLATPILVGLAFVSFLIGMAIFILKADNEQGRADGKRLMIWSAIALFVMISIWGLVNIVLAGFGIDLVFPQLKTS